MNVLWYGATVLPLLYPQYHITVSSTHSVTVLVALCLFILLLVFAIPYTT